MSNKVNFYYQTSFRFTARNVLKALIKELFYLEKVQLEHVSVIFTTDELLLEMNQSFLRHDYYTDVITFTLSTKGQPVEGEIYISIDRVKENAKTQAESFATELRRVVLHGCLHLCGYNDSTAKQKAAMTKKEDYYLTLNL